METVSIKGLDKARVLAALHNGTRCRGLGALHDIGECSVERAQADIDRMDGERLYFDYYYGRPLKVDITDNEFNPVLYDRDAGQGAAAAAIRGISQP